MKILNYIKGFIYIYKAVKSYTIGRLTRERDEARNEAETLKRMLGKYRLWARHNYTINLLHDLDLYVPAEWEPEELREQLDDPQPDDDELPLPTHCPHCRREFDEIDQEYQMCSKCGYNSTFEYLTR